MKDRFWETISKADALGFTGCKEYGYAKWTAANPRADGQSREAAAEKLTSYLELRERYEALCKYFSDKEVELQRRGVEHPQLDDIFRSSRRFTEQHNLELRRLKFCEERLTDLKSRLQYYLDQFHELSDRVARMRLQLEPALADHPRDGHLLYYRDLLSRFEIQLSHYQLPERGRVADAEAEVEAYLAELSAPAELEPSLPEKMAADLLARFAETMTVAEEKKLKGLLDDIAGSGASLKSRLALWELLHQRQAALRGRVSLPPVKPVEWRRQLSDAAADRGWSLMHQLASSAIQDFRFREQFDEALRGPDPDERLRKLESVLKLKSKMDARKNRKEGSGGTT